MSIKKKLTAIALAVALAAGVAACGTQANRVSYNVSQDAENFKVQRRLAVINTITDKPQLELVGYFSIAVDSAQDQLEITVREEGGTFKKHFVGLTPTVTYVVEDITGSDVSAYRYQISFLPEAILPVEIVRGSN